MHPESPILPASSARGTNSSDHRSYSRCLYHWSARQTSTIIMLPSIRPVRKRKSYQFAGSPTLGRHSHDFRQRSCGGRLASPRLLPRPHHCPHWSTTGLSYAGPEPVRAVKGSLVSEPGATDCQLVAVRTVGRWEERERAGSPGSTDYRRTRPSVWC